MANSRVSGNRLLVALFAALALLLAACGGGAGQTEGSADVEAAPEAEGGATDGETAATEAATTEGCPEDYPSRPITWIVPYSPGGGSDQQVRRLQSHLEEILGVGLNVTYAEGGDGAVGWQQLASADPDGYTVSNVVLPNVVLLGLRGENVGFEPDSFEYIAFTETTPNALMVAADSAYQTLDDFISAAEADPGALTIAGVGDVGEMLVGQVTEATGMDITYVPVAGGVGDIVPQLVGGHIDAFVSGASHALANADTVRALALSGEEPLPALEGVPTFAEEGYEGVTLGTSWGAAAPPGASPELVQCLNDAINEAVAVPEVTQAMEDQALQPLEQTPEEADAYVQEMVDTVESILGSS